MQVGGNLSLKTLQETDYYNSKYTGYGLGLGLPSSGRASVHGGAGREKINSSYRSVNEQAGIYAGEGGYDIHVGGNTGLTGAVIASEADAEKNKLSTDTLTWSDITNSAEYSGKSIGIEINHTFAAGQKAGEEAPAPKSSNPRYNQQGITPSIGVPVTGDAESITRSAIAEGEIEVRGNPGQDRPRAARRPAKGRPCGKGHSLGCRNWPPGRGAVCPKIHFRGKTSRP
jgi:filamentous hemagglutinin